MVVKSHVKTIYILIYIFFAMYLLQVLSTLSPDVKEFTPKHNQSLDVNKLGQFSNLSPDVPEFVPSKHLAGTSGPHQVNLNTDQHRCVAGYNSWGGSASLIEERAVGNCNNAEEMPSRTVAGRKSYKKEREHIASGEVKLQNSIIARGDI